jgi:hypothetical protein
MSAGSLLSFSFASFTHFTSPVAQMRPCNHSIIYSIHALRYCILSCLTCLPWTQNYWGLLSTVSVKRLLSVRLTLYQLPIYSGLTLSVLEEDPLFTSFVQAILDLASWRLKDIVTALCAILDTVSKVRLDQK